MLHDAPLGTLDTVRYGFGTEAAMNFGLCGGYPSRNVQWRVVTDSDVMERLERGDLPKSLEELKGNLKHISAIGVLDLTNKDVLFLSWHGGGGYGDPLDRDPEAVRRDVINEFVSLGNAMDVYGVIVDPESLEVDIKKTEQKRMEIRQNRLKARKASGS
jgi:N-methylhydantoinase B